jgi:hypothetical protein
MTNARLLAILLGLAVAAAPHAAGAATNDRPKAGRYAGEHAFNGPVKLRFKREDGIGLYVHSYSVRGTVRCGEEDIPIDYSGRVTARTAARVKKDRSFRLSIAGMRLSGRFVSAKRVRGDIELILSSCNPSTQTGGFGAKRL